MACTVFCARESWHPAPSGFPEPHCLRLCQRLPGVSWKTLLPNPLLLPTLLGQERKPQRLFPGSFLRGACTVTDARLWDEELAHCLPAGQQRLPRAEGLSCEQPPAWAASV